MFERCVETERAAGKAVTQNSRQASPLVLDDVHSFVLRVSLNRSPGGQGRHRPQFQLEYVNCLDSRRFSSLEDVLVHLRTQIQELFEGLGVSEGG
jgi:hypothetical protein